MTRAAGPTLLSLSVVIWAQSTTVAAQPPATTDAQVSIDDLRAPTSPAFTLLDVTPSAVDRPQNVKAFGLGLLSRITSESGAIPKNYALEVAPYWLYSHPELTFTGYYNQRKLGDNLMRTFSVSVATTPLAASGSAAAGSRLALGWRVMPVPGRQNPALAKLKDQLLAKDAQLLAIATASARLAVRLAKDKLQRELRNTADPAKRVAIQEEIRKKDDEAKAAAAADPATAAKWKELQSEAGAIARKITALDAERVGFRLMVAQGEVWDFPGDLVAAQRMSRWALWATPSFRLLACFDDDECQSSVDFIGVVRYISDRPLSGTVNRWDAGGRLLWQASKPLALSAEFLRRSGPTDSTASNRTTGMLEYRLNDDMLLFASFGRNFDDAPDHRTLVSQMGLSFGFGQKPIIDLSK